MEYHRRLGGDVIVVRPFAQTGPGQGPQFVVPAFLERIMAAKARGDDHVAVGNLEPVREFLDVRDVATALGMLIGRGEAGGVYNIASGDGITLQGLFELISKEVGWHGRAEADPALFRKGDVPYVVGDGGRLRSLGWSPRYDLASTIRDMIHEVGD